MPTEPTELTEVLDYSTLTTKINVILEPHQLNTRTDVFEGALLSAAGVKTISKDSQFVSGYRQADQDYIPTVAFRLPSISKDEAANFVAFLSENGVTNVTNKYIEPIKINKREGTLIFGFGDDYKVIHDLHIISMDIVPNGEILLKLFEAEVAREVCEEAEPFKRYHDQMTKILADQEQRQREIAAYNARYKAEQEANLRWSKTKHWLFAGAVALAGVGVAAMTLMSSNDCKSAPPKPKV